MASHDCTLITSDHDYDYDADLPSLKKPRLSTPTSTAGADLLREFSHHDPSVARINNGSFGCCPSSVLSSQRRWQLRFLRQPDLFYSRFLRPSIDSSRRLLLPLINASHLHEISLVDNATTATAIVLQHISRRFPPGDAAIMLHYAYGSVKKSVRAYLSRAGGHVIEVPLPFPVHSNEEIIAEFRNSLLQAKSENHRVRFAVIDHITSMPSVVIPVKELVRICREEGVDKVFIDAAHGIGCTRGVDMKEIGADFYASNLHKWMFCPPSVALLYVRNGHELEDIHHPVVSSEYGRGLPVESAWVGTRDYSSQLVVPEVLEFVSRFEGGMEGIIQRNHDAVVEKGKMLAQAWGTHLGCAPGMCASMMMVGLPACLGVESEEDTMKLRSHLRERFDVEVPIYYRTPLPKDKDKDNDNDKGGCVTGYARISHQVYNTDADYDRFRDAVNQLVRDGFTCSMLTHS